LRLCALAVKVKSAGLVLVVNGDCGGVPI
jgi:hypothetical protein